MTQVWRLAAGVVALGSAYLGCLSLVRAVRRGRQLGLAAPLALALLVCVETLLLRALSIWSAVAPLPVATGNLVVGAAAALLAWGIRPERAPRMFAGRPGGAGMVRLALLALVGLAALAYRPNNFDSMTYHLARVAHWIQLRSVGPYPTNVTRQVLLPPGAEYLVLVLQVISGSDRLANLVQLGAWLVVAGAAAPLARCFGSGRALAKAGALVVMAAPMALLQASSTQNDLVAAGCAVAMASAVLPLLHREARWRPADLALLSVAVAAGLLVKPTAALFAAPLLAVGAFHVIRSAPGVAGPRLAAGVVVLTLAAGAVAPVVLAGRAGASSQEAFLYQGLGSPFDRAVNGLRGLLRNLPLPDAFGAPLSPPQTVGCNRPDSLCLDFNRWPHEDFSGNPAIALLVLASLAVAVVAWRRISGRGRLGAVALVLGWMSFHALFRDNAWITRLQLPAVALAPLALGAVPRGWQERSSWRPLLGALVVAAVLHGGWVAIHNQRRPLRLEAIQRGSGEEGYYAPDVPIDLVSWHGAVLGALARTGCRQLAVYTGGNSYDYPISWRAMLRGVEVRTVVASDGWGCALFTDIGPPPGQRGDPQWTPTEVPGFYVARVASIGPATGAAR